MTTKLYFPRTALAATLATFVVAPAIQAQEVKRVEYEKTLGYVRYAVLDVQDKVTGNCWTNVDLVKSKIKLLLEQNDVAVVEEIANSDFTRPSIAFNVMGWKAGGVCVASAEFSVTTWDYMLRRTKGNETVWLFDAYNTLFSRGYLMTNGGNVNSSVAEFAETSTSEFLADVIAGRRDPNVNAFFEQFPHNLETPLNYEEYKALHSKSD